MKFIETSLPGVILIEPVIFGDERGFFLETYRKKDFAEAGIGLDFVQDNHSKSVRNTMRGLHFQHPFGQAKLVRVFSGEVFDVAVDVRAGSPTFGKWFGAYLNNVNKHQLYIPAGFAHGFCVTSEEAEFVYKCSEYYHPETERTILWNDPQLGIDWPVTDPLLSGKDRLGNLLADMENLPEFNNSSVRIK
jgi:dTDP-4-dehydrorhamnose 3,5-epimerase